MERKKETSSVFDHKLEVKNLGRTNENQEVVVQSL